MDRGNVLSGAAFSAVLMSAMAFLAVLITVGVLAHAYVEQSMTQELRQDVQARWNLFAADYRDEDLEALKELIESAVRFSTGQKRAFGLFDADGTAIAGNILVLPEMTGWQQAPVITASAVPAAASPDGKENYLYHSGRLDSFTLVVGQRMDSIFLTEQALFRALALSGFIVTLTMLVAGYYFSRTSLQKLEQLERTLALVSDGDLAARVALSPNNDQIDRIAVRMNAHLDTLSRLMLTTRSTAAAVAHDLKSPLARAYLGLGRALSQIEAGQDPRTEIEDTQAELVAMNAIFDTILRLARIEAGADGAAFTEVDLAALLDEMAETYQVVAEENAQVFTFASPDGADFTLAGDEGLLRQLVVNLLQNAVTHCSAGDTITLGLSRVAGKICLEVADTGPGIPKAAHDAVFEPFHRLDPSRSKPGSGLGLALVRAIAERHGASIMLSDNAPGLKVMVVFDAVDPVKGSVKPA